MVLSWNKLFTWFVAAAMVMQASAVSTLPDPSIPDFSSPFTLDPVEPITTTIPRSTTSSLMNNPKTTTNPPSATSSLTNIPAQPQCWVEALKIFLPRNPNEMEVTAQVCESMGPHEQKALAFELARCHLQDLGRSILGPRSNRVRDAQECTLAHDRDDANHNSHAYIGNLEEDGMMGRFYFPNLQHCLSTMTDQAVNVYTQYKLQIVSLCNRLTQHLLIHYQQYAATQLAQVSQQATAQITSLLQQQQDMFQEREKSMRNEHKEFVTQIKQQQDRLATDQTSHWKNLQSWTKSMFQNWQDRDQQQKAQHDAFMFNQSIIMKNRAAELERQHQEIQTLAQTVASTTQTMQPLLGLDTIISSLTSGFTLLTFMLHSTVALYVVWLLTRPRCCARVRGLLYTMVFLEAVGEVVIYFGVEGGSGISDAGRKATVHNLRQLTYVLEGLVYVLGTMLSCFCCCSWSSSHEEEDEDDDDDGKLSKNLVEKQTNEMQAQFQKMWAPILEQQIIQQQQQFMSTGHLQHSFTSPFMPATTFPQGFSTPNHHGLLIAGRYDQNHQVMADPLAPVVTCDGHNYRYIRALEAQNTGDSTAVNGAPVPMGIPPNAFFTPVSNSPEQNPPDQAQESFQRLLRNMKNSPAENAAKVSTAAVDVAAQPYTSPMATSVPTNHSTTGMLASKRSREEINEGEEEEDLMSAGKPAKRSRLDGNGRVREVSKTATETEVMATNVL